MSRVAAALAALLVGCGGVETAPDAPAPATRAAAASAGPVDHTRPEERRHLSNMRKLTHGGTNAEAYWAFDDSRLVMQITKKPEVPCDQIFLIDPASGQLTQLTNAGRTTCAFFLPGNQRVLFASTHAAGRECPPKADRSQGYVWDVYGSYDIYTSDLTGGDLVNLTDTPGYDAEATISRQGRVVFTSQRSGDLELWTMAPDGTDLRQVTDRLGYDGGAFFSNDGERLVWRATRFDSDEEREEYKALLARNLVKPSKMELFIADADGGNLRQLTDNGKANFAPFFTPDDRHIVFASSMGSDTGYGFDLWMMPVEGGEPERITYTDREFESFPMFSWDGKRIAFTSGRDAENPGDLDLFIADWTP